MMEAPAPRPVILLLFPWKEVIGGDFFLITVDFTSVIGPTAGSVHRFGYETNTICLRAGQPQVYVAAEHFARFLWCEKSFSCFCIVVIINLQIFWIDFFHLMSCLLSITPSVHFDELNDCHMHSSKTYLILSNVFFSNEPQPQIAY